jgi:hypothetical protein
MAPVIRSKISGEDDLEKSIKPAIPHINTFTEFEKAKFQLLA